jgi:hypothetical protein
MKWVILLIVDVIRGAGVNTIINIDTVQRRMISTGWPIIRWNAIIYRKMYDEKNKRKKKKNNRKKVFIITWRLLVGFGSHIIIIIYYSTIPFRAGSPANVLQRIL